MFGAPEILPEDIDEVVATLQWRCDWRPPSDDGLGERVRDYVGTAHAVALGSCTGRLG